MKILFSNPPWWGPAPKPGATRPAGVRAGARSPALIPTAAAPGTIAPGEYIPYPHLMASAAAYVTRHAGHAPHVRLRDSIALRESYEAFYAGVAAERPEMIFIESSAESWSHDLQMLSRLRQILPAVRLVLCLPEAKSINSGIPGVDACLLGEYEKSACAVIDGAKGVLPSEPLSATEWDEAPAPYYDDLTGRSYFEPAPIGTRFPQLQVASSRPCIPASPHARRLRSAAQVEKQIDDLLMRMQFQSINLIDDVFNADADHVRSICTVLHRKRLPWTANCRPDTIPLELWLTMRDSGCVGIRMHFGYCGNKDELSSDGIHLRKARDVVFHLRKLDLSVHGVFSMGAPGETVEQRNRILAFARTVPFDSSAAVSYRAADARPAKSPAPMAVSS